MPTGTSFGWPIALLRASHTMRATCTTKTSRQSAATGRETTRASVTARSRVVTRTCVVTGSSSSPDDSGGNSDRASFRTAGLAVGVNHLQGGTGLVPCLCERLVEHLGGLRAGDAVLLVDDEERDARRAVGPGLRDIGVHLVEELPDSQDLLDPNRVQANAAGRSDKRRVGKGWCRTCRYRGSPVP